MARLSKRERQAKALWVKARSQRVRVNLATGFKSGSERLLVGLTFISGNGRERSVLSCLQGTRHEDSKALKQHSLTRGCSAPASGHGSGTGYDRLRHATISALIRGGKQPKAAKAKPKGLWSEPVPQDKLPDAWTESQEIKARVELHESDLVSIARSNRIGEDAAKALVTDKLTVTGTNAKRGKPRNPYRPTKSGPVKVWD